MKAMLAASTDPAKLVTYAQDDNWWFQQKVDGVRAVFICEDGQVKPLNRNGVTLTKEVPRQVLAAFKPLATGGTVVVDGELVEGAFWAFDLPIFGSAISWRSAYADRYEALKLVVSRLAVPEVRLLDAAQDTPTKLTLARDVLAAGLEGIIMRDKRSPYVPGARVDTLQKVKFVKHVDCVVMAVNLDGKQNMRLGVYDAKGTLVSIGECTGLSGDGPTICDGLPGNPNAYVGSVVEVRYLSVYHHRLYQPNMPRIRTDKAPNECTIDQLRLTNRRVLA